VADQLQNCALQGVVGGLNVECRRCDVPDPSDSTRFRPNLFSSRVTSPSAKAVDDRNRGLSPAGFLLETSVAAIQPRAELSPEHHSSARLSNPRGTRAQLLSGEETLRGTPTLPLVAPVADWPLLPATGGRLVCVSLPTIQFTLVSSSGVSPPFSSAPRSQSAFSSPPLT